MRPRLPPSARRIAISLRRAVPRASSMFARFKQATSRTTAAMPEQHRCVDRVVFDRGGAGGEPVQRRRHERLIFLFTGKCSLEICRETFQRWPAASAVTPGLRRPMTMRSLPRSARESLRGLPDHS